MNFFISSLNRINIKGKLLLPAILTACVFSVFSEQPLAYSRDPVDQNGRLCVSGFRAVSQEQETQKGIYEHYVYATNSCNRTINYRICYTNKPRDCSNLAASPGRESMTTLGIKVGEPNFTYTYQYVE